MFLICQQQKKGQNMKIELNYPIIIVHRYIGPTEPRGGRHAAVLRGAQVLAAHRGARGVLRHLQGGGQRGALHAVLLRREDRPGWQAAYYR